MSSESKDTSIQLNDVISKQAITNISVIGQFSHGKSITVKALTDQINMICNFGQPFQRISEFQHKIKFTNAKIYKCENPLCHRPGCYRQHRSNSTADNPKCENNGCGSAMKLIRHVCYIDYPTHNVLMGALFNCERFVDATMLVIASNEPCPQQQTADHLAIVEILKLKNIIIVQNKIDLVRQQSRANEHHNQIQQFVKGSVAEGAPIIPISAQLKWNIDVLCEHVVTKIPTSPISDNYNSAPHLIVVRSFNMNAPYRKAEEMKGGTVRGLLLSGILRVGDDIEIRPGIITKNHDGTFSCTPLFSKIVSLFAEDNELQYAVPGGLIGVLTKLDPSLCKSDRLAGRVLGRVGIELPDISISLEISFFLLRHLLDRPRTSESKIRKLSKGDTLMIIVGLTAIGCRVTAVKKDLAKLALLKPICTNKSEKVAMFRRIQKRWHLIGWCIIQKGEQL
ncbi:hypothetical protein PPL_04959 [Heterostelium album PN500]|uniref:protein-synthesizing GTPase n=1 Tax=Heterostelium pallidum (strain ATCC 26659 / Pp 5 / PN500) TaxID=670386 RepID=D3B915_HETP5|nr:hypothetical protein PPL_04959 [Heterostelium album PN500]EFA82054.1 hypothetical protein PPL_04959 [Heterostelium album PN500]|eukprot:XP_020434171.1 hypothetical protein PPL_04959 [Heterostelium album PN500]